MARASESSPPGAPSRTTLLGLGALWLVFTAVVLWVARRHAAADPALLTLRSHPLPVLNALLNATSATLLIAGFVAVKRGRLRAHRACLLGAVLVSLFFLTSYVVYHFHAGSVRFQGRGPIRTLYLSILLTHTVLAVAIVPLVALTLRGAFARDFARHRRLARTTFPLWVYVALSGIVVYLMLYRLPL